ncbi:adhesion G-protein coupled receptor G5-like isoform X1 [Arapaima gigas]
MQITQNTLPTPMAPPGHRWMGGDWNYCQVPCGCGSRDRGGRRTRGIQAGSHCALLSPAAVSSAASLWKHLDPHPASGAAGLTKHQVCTGSMKPLDLVGTLTFTFFLLGVSRSKNSCPELDPNNNTVTKPFQVDQCKKFLTSAARTANISFFMETLLKLEKLLIWLPETSEYNNLVKNTTKATFNLSDFQINSTVTVSLDEYPDPDQKLIFLPFTAQELLEPLDVLFGLVFGVTLVNYKKKVVNADAKIMLSTEECPAALLQPAKMPDCRFYNYTTGRFERSGCRTDWKRDRCQVECSCNHTTFFALLMVPSNISEVDLTALTYISLVGCSVSIVFLPLSLVIYVCNR